MAADSNPAPGTNTELCCRAAVKVWQNEKQARLLLETTHLVLPGAEGTDLSGILICSARVIPRENMGHRFLLNPMLPVLQERCKSQCLLLSRVWFFSSITPKYVPKMFFNSIFHNKAGTCLCSQSVAGRRKGNFLMFVLPTRLKLQPPKKNSSVSSISATQEPAGTAAAHPQN